MTERETTALAKTPNSSSRPWLAPVWDALASIFFPAPCRICEDLLDSASRVPICGTCLSSFQAIAGPICEICGLPVQQFDTGDETGKSTCSVCRIRVGQPDAQRYAFARARSYAVYSHEVIHAILLLKFERMEPLAALFAGELARIYERERGILESDVLVPVPLHRQREKERGYNQADLLAKPLAKRLGLPRRPVLLVRTKPRPNKQVLSMQERWHSVRGAFATRPGSQVDNKRVLLVDDVMTTGATLDACARALLKAGAKSVVGLTVARALQKPVAVDK